MAGSNEDGRQSRPAHDPGAAFELLPIYLRGYVESVAEDDDADAPKRAGSSSFQYTPTDSLVFDTETTTDHTQAFRVGAYQLRTGGRRRAGLFYDPDILTEADIAVVREYATAHDLRLLTVREFVDFILYSEAYQTGAAIIGFNLPFDLSRLATDAATAKRLSDAFTLTLSSYRSNPPIQIKNLNSRAALTQFMSLGDGGGESQRRRRVSKEINRGFFVDVKTGACALFGKPSFSLETLCTFLRVDTPKKKTEEHGKAITPEYLDYLMTDVQATWECHEKLQAAYRIHNLTKTGFHRIYSEASIGKAYLKEMGIQPWAKVQPDFPREMIGHIMSAYYGGRAEVRIRRKIVRVLYCDFASMYPTICTLMGLWQFFISQGDDWTDSTDATAAFLEAVTVDELQDPAAWRRLTTLVEVEPGGEVFPVRAKYEGDPNSTIALNHLRSETPLWFTLADCVAAKLLSGTAPKVKRAITFTPRVKQAGLSPILFAGDRNYRVDPNEDDLFKRVIELRNEVKTKIDRSTGAEKEQLKATEQALKLFANSTSYGINIEVIVDNHSTKHNALVYGLEQKPIDVRVHQEEKQGTNFHPLLAVLITGGARLMLALSETLARAKGLDWALCDTDSMALARPDGMADADFVAKGREIVGWFQRLNPYTGNKPLFKMEPHNFPLGRADSDDAESAPLYCLAISAKRYALFNLDSADKPVLRKISGHGLGHLSEPYEKDPLASNIPEPKMDLQDERVPRWHHDLWYRIVEAQLATEANPSRRVVRPVYSDLPGFQQPAVSRYGASTPRLLAWFKHLNADKLYADKVKPFNFMYGYQAKGSLDREFDDGAIAESHSKGRRSRHQPHAVAPYDSDKSKALKRVFDRISGEPVPPAELMTYEQALADYDLNTESKFLNGGRFESGRTGRRSVEVLSVIYIGKEADRLEEAFFLGVETDIEYAASTESSNALTADVLAAINKFGRNEFERACGMWPSHLSAILVGACTLTRSARQRLVSAIETLNGESAEIDRLLDMAREELKSRSLRQLALELDMDWSNFAKALGKQRGRGVPKGLITKLRARYLA